MKIVKCFLFALIPLFSYEVGNAQCLTPVKEYVNESARHTEPKEGQIYFMQFSVKSIPASKFSSEIAIVSSKIFRSKGQLIYETKDVDIYQDELNAFMIIHPNKRIIWSKEPEKIKNEATNKIAALQKNLLESSQLIDCSISVAENGHDIISIKLKTSDDIKNEFKVAYSLMKFDRTLNQLLKVETIYEPDQPLARQIIEYQKLDYNYKGMKIKPAKSMIFNSKGQVKPEFKQYTFIEN